MSFFVSLASSSVASSSVASSGLESSSKANSGFASSSTASSGFTSSSAATSGLANSYYPTQTENYYRREATSYALALRFGNFLRESWDAFCSIFINTFFALLVLIIGNGILKASMHGHLTYRIISLATFIGSLITHGTLQIVLRIYKNLPERMKLPWIFGFHKPNALAVYWFFYYPAINASICGMLGILALRSSNSSHIELHSKTSFLFVAEAAAIGSAILLLAFLILLGWSLEWVSFDPREYYPYIRNRPSTSTQTPQAQNEAPAAELPQHVPSNKRTRTNSELTDSTAVQEPS